MSIFDTLKKSFNSLISSKPIKYTASSPAKPAGTVPFNQNANVSFGAGGAALQPISSPRTPAPTSPAAQPQPQPRVATPVSQPVQPSIQAYNSPTNTPQNFSQPTIPQVRPQPTPQLQPQPQVAAQPQPAPIVDERLTGARDSVSESEKAYLKSLQMSPEEDRTQADLDRLISATKQGYTGIKNKVIPLEFITGQLAATEERAVNLAEPLESKLTRLQASRQASLNASTFSLDRADKKLEAIQKENSELNKPMTIGSGSSVIQRDSATGEYKTVFQGAQQDEGGELLTPNEAVALGVPYGTTKSQAYGVQSSSLTPKQQTRVDNIRSQFVTSPIVKQYNEVVNKAYTVENILQNGELGGPSDLALVFEFMKALDPTSVVRETEYEAAAKSGNIFRGALAKFNGYFKPEGGFLPQTVKDSFNEIVKIKLDAATRQYDNYKSESERLIGQVTGDSGGDYLPNFSLPKSQPRSLQEYYQGNPQDRQSVEQMIRDNPNLSDDDILQILIGDFSNVGGDTNQALNRPQRNNNPGNVKSGGLADNLATGTDDQGHLVFPDPQTGFRALAMDLNAKLSGQSQYVRPGATIAELGKVYAEDPNWPNSVAKMLGVSPNTVASQVDFNQLVEAIAKQEGFYA